MNHRGRKERRAEIPKISSASSAISAVSTQFDMSMKILHEPDYAFHPGETLAETLEELGMSQKELAERAGRPLKTINEIVQGKTAITADTALQLERVTGVPASFWNNAQRNYEAFLARQAESEALQAGIEWLKSFPIQPLWKLGWVPKLSDPIEQLRALLGFFGVAGVEEWRNLWQQPDVAFRKSNAFTAHPMAVAAWLREGERQAQRVATRPFGKDRFISALIEIRKLTSEEPETFEPAMKTLCAEAGVAVVLVPEVTGTRAYGATRWLSPEKAILQLSLRGKAEDFLWFTFFHEAAHILKHGKKDVFIEAPEGTADAVTQRKEVEANTFAADFLIPREAYRELIGFKPHTAAKIRSFADRLGIAPGIVVGRLQHDKLIPFKQHNCLKRRFQFCEQP
jgi:HTH-type transcriptional regulator / antitoxin HigA